MRLGGRPATNYSNEKGSSNNVIITAPNRQSSATQGTLDPCFNSIKEILGTEYYDLQRSLKDLLAFKVGSKRLAYSLPLIGLPMNKSF